MGKFLFVVLILNIYNYEVYNPTYILLIKYGEGKVKNSFKIYAEFISKEENKDLNKKYDFIEDKTDEARYLISKMLNQDIYFFSN